MTRLPDMPGPKVENGNGEVIEFGVGGGGKELAKKSRKSKGHILSKSRKSAKSKKNLSKSKNSPKFGTTEAEPSLPTPGAREAFNRLWLAFIEAPIFRYFDPEYYIWIETNALGYVIDGVLSLLVSGTRPDGVITKTDLGKWYLVVFFLSKIIPAETQYKTYDSELLAIVEAFKTWRYYLEGCKHEVLVLTDYNNSCRFMDTKSLSSRLVRWAQKLSQYQFQIDYRQDKAKAATDALSRFSQRSQDKKDELRAENSQIFHHLQNSLTNTSLAELSFLSRLLSHLDQVLICGTYILPQLQHLWNGHKKSWPRKSFILSST